MNEFVAAIVAFARDHGLWGLVVAMVIENLVQFVPSLLLLPLAGYGASQGLYSLPLALLATLAGSLLGCLIWYALGRWFNATLLVAWVSRPRPWLGLTTAQLERSRRWFRAHDRQIVCWGRLVPVLRTNVSLPAGLELMPLGRFLLYSLIGSALWNSTFVLLGFWLGRPTLF